MDPHRSLRQLFETALRRFALSDALSALRASSHAGDPYGIRTHVAGVRGRSLRPLDQRAIFSFEQQLRFVFQPFQMPAGFCFPTGPFRFATPLKASAIRFVFQPFQMPAGFCFPTGFFRFANACQSFLPCKSFVKTMALDLAVKPIPLNHCCKAFGFFNDPAFRQNFPAVLRSVDHKPSICPSGPAYSQFLLEPHKDKTFVLSFLCVGVFLSSQDVAVQVFSAPVSLTSVFGMGTGGPSPLSTPTIRNSSSPFRSFFRTKLLA